MFSQREVDFLRGEAERDFTSICTVYRASAADAEVDLDTLELIDPERITLYESIPCWYQPTTRNYERAFEFGEAKQSSRTYSFRLPWTVLDLRVNDVIVVEESADPFFIGREFVVTDPIGSSEGTERVVIAEIAQGF